MTSSFVHALGAASAPIRIHSAADLRAYRAELEEQRGRQTGQTGQTGRRTGHEMGNERGAPPSVEQAALAGLASGSLGWAFASGYEAAIDRLDPHGARGHALGALCATEMGGGHPRAIRTTLAARGEAYVLSGEKTWVTLGSEADVLLVVASVGVDAQGRNRLRVARVPAAREGVVVAEAPALPFVPEIAHAKATFDAVAIDASELLPGDGYEDALKPFRTIEDVHVTAAVIGWAIGVGRASDWPRAWLEEALALVVLLRALGEEPASAPETHVTLAGAQVLARRLLGEAAWSKTSEATRACWERDHRLLDVASTVRAARLEAAWRALGRS